MRTARVMVLPYDEAWAVNFDNIKRELESALGAFALRIEHVGSTSVRGMCAKPCIDIDVVIKDYSVFDEVVRLLSEIGYIHEGDLGIKDREAFKYENKPHLQAHHLYVCPEYSEELHRHIRFRDFLRSDSASAKEYGQVKQAAAKLYPNDIEKYIEYKSSCIERLYAECGLKG